MSEFKIENILDCLENGLGKEGDLCLFISCSKCDARFELNNQAVTIAIGMNIPFIEYVRFVQNSKCPICSEKKQ